MLTITKVFLSFINKDFQSIFISATIFPSISYTVYHMNYFRVDFNVNFYIEIYFITPIIISLDIIVRYYKQVQCILSSLTASLKVQRYQRKQRHYFHYICPLQ